MDRSDPRGPESRKIFLTSQILWLHAPRKTDHDKRESPSYQETPRAKKEGQGPQSPPVRKSLQRSILLIRRLEGYCRVSILGTPKARKLAPTLTSPDGSRHIKRSHPTPRSRTPSRPTPRSLRAAAAPQTPRRSHHDDEACANSPSVVTMKSRFPKRTCMPRT